MLPYLLTSLVFCLFASPHRFVYTSVAVKECFETTVRVRYAETDQMGVAYHANFLVWFELGRVELLRQLGVRYREMEEHDDCHIVVAEARCSYKRPARYDDPLRIRTRVAEARSRTLRFTYEIFHDETHQLLATGETIHVICGANGRPKALPPKYRKLFPFTNAALASHPK